MSPCRWRIHRGAVSECGRIDVEYRWRLRGSWNAIELHCEGRPQPAAEESLQQSITEHHWGYATQRDGTTKEYRVAHERWRVWDARPARFTGDCAALYGEDLARCLEREPDSAFLAAGSAVTVYAGQRLSDAAG